MSEKYFAVKENFTTLKFEGDWAKSWQEICFLRQSQTKYLDQNTNNINNIDKKARKI